MAVITRSTVPDHWPVRAAFAAVICLPLTIASLPVASPPWVLMWALALAVYGSLKCLSLADSGHLWRWSSGRMWAYLLLWPGMDARAFLASARQVDRPARAEWLLAAVKVALAAALMAAAVSLVGQHSVVAGWVGMAGVAFTLHFGLFHVLSLIWRRAGIDAPAIMDAPILSASLSEFWGRRWNLSAGQHKRCCAACGSFI